MNEFSELKAIQVLSYLEKHKIKTDFKTLLKLIFFAERYSLRKYCISILGDCFYAMAQGPVASIVYDMLKGAHYFQDPKLEQNIITTGKNVHIIFNGDYNHLSQSDIEALDFSINNFGNYSPDKLSDISHCYPEWSNCESKFTNERKSVLMNVMDFFKDPCGKELEKLQSLIGLDPFKSDNIDIVRSIYLGQI